MDKKIVSMFLLLIIVIAATVTYIASNQLSPVENQQNYAPVEGDITEEDIVNEVDNFIISEDDEIEIGDMI